MTFINYSQAPNSQIGDMHSVSQRIASSQVWFNDLTILVAASLRAGEKSARGLTQVILRYQTPGNYFLALLRSLCGRRNARPAALIIM